MAGPRPAAPLGGALLLLLVQVAVAPLVAFVLLWPVIVGLLGHGEAPIGGAAVGLISIAGGLLTLGALAMFARHWPAPRQALALVPGRLPWWVAPPVVLGLAMASDMVAALAGRPIVPPQLVPLFSGGVDRLLMGIAVVVIAPPVEELVYRGALYGAIEARWGAGTACVLTTLVFAGSHVGTFGDDLVALGQVVALGGLLTGLRAASGSLIPGLVGHLAANAYATALLLLIR